MIVKYESSFKTIMPVIRFIKITTKGGKKRKGMNIINYACKALL